MDSFRVLGPNLVGYLDVSGSGNETQAHLGDNGRITIMFCAFDQPPLILRVYGNGRAILPQDDEWDIAERHFEIPPRHPADLHDRGGKRAGKLRLGRAGHGARQGAHHLSRYHEQNETPERLEKIATRTQSIDGLPLRVARTASPSALIATSGSIPTGCPPCSISG